MRTPSVIPTKYVTEETWQERAEYARAQGKRAEAKIAAVLRYLSERDCSECGIRDHVRQILEAP